MIKVDFFDMTKSAQHTPSALSRRLFLAGGAACALAALAGSGPATLAYADELGEKIDEYQELADRIKELKAELEEATESYYKAETLYGAAKADADDAQAAIDANTAELEALQKRLARRVEVVYRNDEASLLDLLIDSSSLEDFAEKWDMIERMNDGDAALASEIRVLRSANEEKLHELDASKEKAERHLKEAEQVQLDAKEKVAELEALYEDVTEELELLLGIDQLAALKYADDVLIIGNPRNIAPHPEVVEFAKSRIGCPYVWAAAGPTEFDCSGLVVWCFDKAGISGLPHYTESLYKLALYVGAVLPLEDVEPGDVLYRPGHVGIASGAGGRPYIHAPNAGAYVRDTDSLMFSGFCCGLRFPGAGTLSAEELAAVLAQISVEIANEEEQEKRETQTLQTSSRNNSSKNSDSDAKAKAKAEEEARRKAEAEAARKQAEAEEAARKQAEAEAAAKAEEEARRKAEEEAARQAAEAEAASSSDGN